MGKPYSDDLVSITIAEGHNYEKAIKKFSVDAGLNAAVEYKEFENVLNGLMYSTLSRPFRLEIKELLKVLIKVSKELGWVNIEKIFYNQLIKEYDKLGDSEPDVKFKVSVIELNKQLEYLASELKKYIKSLKSQNVVSKSLMEKIFDSKIDMRLPFSIKMGLIYEYGDKINLTDPNHTRILNFNYTDTILNYFAKDKVIDIHGRCDLDDPIIFGYGDEKDENYKKIEMSGIDEALDHMKSFGYFQSSAYQDLMAFVESNEFQVFIIGHSCGLSDRTLLSHIFEHKNCISISPFYHEDKKNYVRLTQNISRHFDDKILMRQKVEPFSEELLIPKLME